MSTDAFWCSGTSTCDPAPPYIFRRLFLLFSLSPINPEEKKKRYPPRRPAPDPVILHAFARSSSGRCLSTIDDPNTLSPFLMHTQPANTQNYPAHLFVLKRPCLRPSTASGVRICMYTWLFGTSFPWVACSLQPFCGDQVALCCPQKIDLINFACYTNWLPLYNILCCIPHSLTS